MSYLEVNLLFQRTPAEPKFWYFERQIERWQLAADASKNHKIVNLDGDSFQTVWYNRSYDFGEPFEETMDFYRRELAAGKIAFPDKYFVLSLRQFRADFREKQYNFPE